MKILTSKLIPPALDCMVSHCVEWSKKFPIFPLRVLPYSTDWEQGGPIIELTLLLTCCCTLRTLQQS